MHMHMHMRMRARTQVGGTSPWRSKPSYPFSVWSLLEMQQLGVATPLNASYAGACA